MANASVSSYAFIVNCLDRRPILFPAAEEWPLDTETVTRLVDWFAKLSLNEPFPVLDSSISLTSAQRAHYLLSQSRTFRYVHLPSLCSVGMHFVALYARVNENIVNGDTSEGGKFQMFAVVLAIPTRPFRMSLLPTIRDWLEMAHMEILWKYVVSQDVSNAASSRGVSVDPDWVFTDFNDEWTKKLAVLRANVELWVNSFVEVEKMDLKKSHLFRIFDESLQQASRPVVAAPRSALRQSVGKPSKQPEQPPPLTPDHFWERLQLVLSVVLTHHSVILRGKNADDVTAWLHTVGYFLPDDKFLLMRVECNPDHIIIPDLHLQGTTLERKRILLDVHMFRYPPLVVDIDSDLIEKKDVRPHLIPTDFLHAFTEKRIQVYCPGIEVLDRGPTGTPSQSFGANCLASTVAYVQKLHESTKGETKKAIPVFSFQNAIPQASAYKSDLVSSISTQVRSIFENTLQRYILSRTAKRTVQEVLRSEIFELSGMADPGLSPLFSLSQHNSNNSFTSTRNRSDTYRTEQSEVPMLTPKPSQTDITADSPPVSLRRNDTQQSEIPGFGADPVSLFPEVTLRMVLRHWRNSTLIRALQLIHTFRNESADNETQRLGVSLRLLHKMIPVATDRKILQVFANFSVLVAAKREEVATARVTHTTQF